MRFERTLRLAGAAAMAAALALAQSGSGSAPNPPAQHQQMRGQMLDRMARKLGLTDDQKAQAKTIFTNAKNEAQPYIPQLKAAREAFQTALNNNAGDAELQKAAENEASLMAKVHVIRAKAMRDFEKILTPDQLQKAKELRAFMRGRFSRGRFGA